MPMKRDSTWNAERSNKRRPIMKRVYVLSVIAFAAFMLLAASPAQRPASWAEPIKLEGVHNFFKVSPELYRSEQPTALGFTNLKKLGIKTVVSLRAFHTDMPLLKDTGLQYEHLYMKTWHIEEKDAVKFLKIVNDPKCTPVLVHCQHGADRTGAMCAVYRIAVQGWTKEQALAEMTEGGYGFHEVWKNLPEWLKNLDVEKLRKDAGLQTKGK
jgi:protein tyrosine/serine phosphatase